MKIISKITLTSLIALIITACDSQKPFRTVQGMVWNTMYHITYASNVSLDDSIQAVMKQVDNSLSVFNDSSLVSLVNRTDSVPVDSLFERVFLESQAINRISSGAFDPTVGPLIEMWGFGKNKKVDRTPSDREIDSVRMTVGINECHIEDGRVIKKSPDTKFNFSAIAKGYGCDLIGDMMRRNGVKSYMIEIGGEIAVSGKSPHGGKWRIMVDAPIQNSDSIIHEQMTIIEVDSCGIATSGNYRNYHIIDGTAMGHSIDPFNGRPAVTTILSATVIAPRCLTADALATACMIMPLDSAIAMIERIPGAAALFVTATHNSEWGLHTTSRFPTLLNN